MNQSLEALEPRYLRLLRFDRFLSVFYAVTACFPIYALFSTSFARAFHLTAVVIIVGCGVGGFLVSTRILRGRLRSEALPYFITIFTIVSRLGFAAWGSYLSFVQVMAAFGADLPRDAMFDMLFRSLLSPFVITVVLIVVFYRVLYHISVHYLLILRGLRQPNQALLPTPVSVTNRADARSEPATGAADL